MSEINFIALKYVQPVVNSFNLRRSTMCGDHGQDFFQKMNKKIFRSAEAGGRT